MYPLFLYLVSYNYYAIAYNGTRNYLNLSLHKVDKFKTDILPRLKLHLIMKSN